MTDDEISELIGLYCENTLPESLHGFVEQYLATHPEAEQELITLRATQERLAAAPQPRPDTWFIERALDGLLRENGVGDVLTRKLGT